MKQWRRQKKDWGEEGAKMTSHLMTSYYQWLARYPVPGGRGDILLPQQKSESIKLIICTFMTMIKRVCNNRTN